MGFLDKLKPPGLSKLPKPKLPGMSSNKKPRMAAVVAKTPGGKVGVATTRTLSTPPLRRGERIR